MITSRKNHLTLVILCLFAASAAFGQNPAPELNISVGESRLRFTPAKPFLEMRLDIVNSVGELVYGNVSVEPELLWNLRSNNHEVLAPGLYAYTLTLKDVEGNLSRHRGNFIIEKGQDQIWLTTKDGNDISGSEMTAARTGTRTIAGAPTAATGEQAKRTLNGRDVVADNGTKLFDAKGQTDKLAAAILGTPNRIVKFGAGGAADTDSLMTESGAVITTAGSQNVTGSYQLNGVNGLRVNVAQQGLFIGESAGNVSSGQNNAFIGKNAGLVNTTGNHNVFLGVGAGQLNVGGSSNMFIGPFAGGNNSSGVGNTFIGASAGDKNTTASNNVAIGSSANVNNVTGGDNVAIGASAGLNNLAGNNVFVGGFAGQTNTTGLQNTYVGVLADGNAALQNAAALGYRAKVTASNSLVLGSISGVNGATASTNVGIGTTAPGSRLDVVGGNLRVSTDGTSRMFMGSDAAGGNIGTVTNHDLTILSNGSPAIFIKAGTMNVGIGTENVTPVDKLEVKGVGTAISATDSTVRTRLFSSAAYPGGFIGTSSSHDFFIRSSDVTRMTFKAAGNVGIGTETPASRLHVSDAIGNDGNLQGHIQVGATVSGPDEKVISFGDLGCTGPCVSIGESGADDQMVLKAKTFLFQRSVSNEGNVIPGADDAQKLGSSTNRWKEVWSANAFLQTSDVRLKKNVTNLRYGLRDLMQLRPVSFEWKSISDERTHLGFVAQETEQIIPEAVYRDKNPDAPLGMTYGELVPVIIKSIQEQQTALTQKDQAIHSLQVQNAALLKRLETVERALVRQTRKPRGR